MRAPTASNPAAPNAATARFDPSKPFDLRGGSQSIEEFEVRGFGYGGSVIFNDGSEGDVFWDQNGRHVNHVDRFDLVNTVPDFPDDSGATDHVVEPVSHDDEDEVLARLIAWFSAPWPHVPGYV